MILLIMVGGFIFVILVISILDALNITHIFMKGRSSGVIGGALRAMQDAFEPNAKKAHEYVIEEKEKIDVSEISDIANDKKQEHEETQEAMS
jgi:hypothetical protein